MHKLTQAHRYHLPIFSLLIVGVLFILAACGGSTTTGTTTSSNPTATPTATVAAPSPTPTTAPTVTGKTMTVTITTDSSGSFTFSPKTLTISVGTTVVWKNMTGAPHTVTSDDGSSFNSGVANPIAAQGGTYQFTFTKAGTFSYHCSIHPFMKATITVQ
jgi:plastocyanin